MMLRRVGSLVLVGLLVATHPSQASASGFIPAKTVRVTYHLPTGRLTYSGTPSFVGTAACSWDIPLGAVAVFKDGRPVICIDRGNLGNEGWIDVYAPDTSFGREVERAYGQRTTVRLFLPAR
jgi:hypothetical protein